jgi:hypothetical protein
MGCGCNKSKVSGAQQMAAKFADQGMRGHLVPKSARAVSSLSPQLVAAVAPVVVRTSRKTVQLCRSGLTECPVCKSAVRRVSRRINGSMFSLSACIQCDWCCRV